MNAYQRIFYGSEHADILLLIRSKQIVSQEIAERVRVHNSFFENRWLFFVYAIIFAGFMRTRGFRIIITEPSGFAAVGYFAKVLFRMFWVLDLWDRPRWRRGNHEVNDPKRLSDRLVFKIMRSADLFLLSVLPLAVKDINPPTDRCAQFYNAIDMSQVASYPPPNPSKDGILHLAFGKSKFDNTLYDDTIGLGVIIKAAEHLKEKGCQFRIHIIGLLSDDIIRTIQSSSAQDLIKIHGFTLSSRIDLFRKCHVGLVPSKAYEDLSYIFPIKVLEHLSQGNPVIASNLPGLSTLIKDGYNGLLVSPGDPVSLADAISKLQNYPDLWERLAHNALDSISQFDACEKNKKIFETIFERLETRLNIAGPLSN